jgi:protein-L-isoaspartate(D-aspartate) O-methyltransferase
MRLLSTACCLLVAIALGIASVSAGFLRRPPENPIFDVPDTASVFTKKRISMVRDQIAGRGVTSELVLGALLEVPRHKLVPKDQQYDAYSDRPLPIGYGQTISQPYIVGLMTELLEPEPGDTVLEVGTGSGYQAAVLSRIVSHVYTIEIVEELGKRARRDISKLGYENVDVRIGDGYYGLPDAAPFDAVIVTAAATHIPPPLIDQMKAGGVMCIPVGPAFQVQRLVLVQKAEDGTVTTKSIMPVRFVPLTGEH